eukprot:04858.XXX_154638_155371_1 [CDS] Oithona nana genome sequencing.
MTMTNMGTIGDQGFGGTKGLPITNYHCVMKCANQLSQATMGPILQPGFEIEYNHECVLIENLDYCVQLWKVMNNVDCEKPIRTMVANTFGENDNRCMRDYVGGLSGNNTQSQFLEHLRNSPLYSDFY